MRDRDNLERKRKKRERDKVMQGNKEGMKKEEERELCDKKAERLSKRCN